MASKRRNMFYERTRSRRRWKLYFCREHTSGDDGRRRNMLQLCQMHYNKASGLLFLLEHPSDLLTVQIERVSLAEFISEMATSNSTKLKSLQSALNFIVECKPILLIMEERNRVLPAKTSNPQLDSAMDEMELAEREEEEKLTTLLEQRLQFILRTIIKLILTGNSQKGSSATAGQNEKLISHYKQAYSALLKRPADQNLVTHLANVVDLIKQH
ncbi:hypothetical protein AAG570_003072 [Ranatra chinensis]|uniref:EDRF1 TPR repeats region domain-containing protein n=1 Tax=Ranatra chinensis TaxID=642074 RepID=A0ABD0Y5T1_9HEMI